MKQKIFILWFLFALIGYSAFAQNNNINQNQNNITIQNNITNTPVIEKTVYIEKYRPVYIERPQPKRYARRLSAPVVLLNYIYVYPEDLGTFRSHPYDIIFQINNQGMHGRNNWRIPTSNELAVIEANADMCGLGDDIYLSTDHSNGVLRLVSTGPTIAEIQRQQSVLAAQEQAQRRAAEFQLQAQREEEQRKREVKFKQEQDLINSGEIMIINGVLWATKNVGASDKHSKGRYISISQSACPPGWRLPTENELNQLMSNCKRFRGIVNGYIISGYQYGNFFLPTEDNKFDESYLINSYNSTKVAVLQGSSCKTSGNYTGLARCIKN